MARYKNRPGGSSNRNTGRQTIWMWIIGGVVLAAMLFMVARTMSTAPAIPMPPQRVNPAKTDLNTYTRMVGEPGIDTTLRYSIARRSLTILAQIESMVSNRELRDAVARMQRMTVRPQLSLSEQALLHGYTAICEYELANPNAALVSLTKGLALATGDDSATSELKTWLAFQAGWLFQYHGFIDSAREYYSLALQTAPAASRLRPLLFNNLGVALEAAGDSTGAADAYRSAVALTDTTTRTRCSERIRDNLHRLAARVASAKH